MTTGKTPRLNPDDITAEAIAALRTANFYIVASCFNRNIVEAMIEHATSAFADYQIPSGSVRTVRVPGAFEIPQAAHMLASRGLCDAIIAFGCVIRGETAHFDSIVTACSEGLMRVSQDFTIPVAHGILMTDNCQQAQKRIERGREVAEAAIRMLALVHGIDKTAFGNK